MMVGDGNQSVCCLVGTDSTSLTLTREQGPILYNFSQYQHPEANYFFVVCLAHGYS